MREFRLRLCLMLIASVSRTISGAQLEEVGSFPQQQVTGVAVSKSGRVFVNFPNWSDNHSVSVAELIDGKAKPFPNEVWNQSGPGGSHFICVQSVYVDADDNLWILDPAAPKMQEAIKGGPKLIKVDLKTNQVAQNIPFGEDVAPKKSYLNDVRVDTKMGVAFITDSGLGAIVVLDLKTGKARRLLKNHKAVMAEPKTKLMVEGRELLDQKGNPPQINSDGIALDSKYDYLYFHALTGHILYRIKTVYLKDPNLSDEDIEPKVESVIETPAADGMLEAPDGSVYLTDIEHNAIVRFDPISNKIEKIIEDKRLSWPDSMSWGPGDEIFVTASQIQNMPRFNNGKDKHIDPYKLFKLKK